ncbi:MAG: hypothetical protein CBB97_02005 [Candidatus Endolissoclinum sp. TMED37]|nr:MAG: hypothetical protein CBB97_02005 [Candidatus Endolissoclinum sp. TMED37]
MSIADLEVDNIIRGNLNNYDPSIKILSEENEFSLNSYLEECYWIIDPIDGTQSYISEGNEYTINIALIYQGKPYLGLIAHPPSKKIWYAKNNKLTIIHDSVKKTYENNVKKKDFITIITSKEFNYETEEFIKNFKNSKRIKLSSSLKFCKLAENEADLYPRFSSISKWDIAAGHAILNASGGEIIKINGLNFNYNNKSSRTGKFLAISRKINKKKLNL